MATESTLEKSANQRFGVWGFKPLGETRLLAERDPPSAKGPVGESSRPWLGLVPAVGEGMGQAGGRGGKVTQIELVMDSSSVFPFPCPV